MENFPGPRFSTPEDIRLLKHVLAANAIDALTSDGSTSPMSPEQIQTHLAMLDKFSTEGDVYQTYAIGMISCFFVLLTYLISSSSYMEPNSSVSSHK